jgi:hypothetical protein
MLPPFPPNNRFRPNPPGWPVPGYERPPFPGGFVPSQQGRPMPHPMTMISPILPPESIRNSHAALYAFERVKHLQRFTTLFIGNIHKDLEDSIVERLLAVSGLCIFRPHHQV